MVKNLMNLPVKIIQKMISDCKKDAEIYRKAGRIEQSEDELKQAAILAELLPKLPTTEDVINTVNDIINEHFEVGHKSQWLIRKI